MGEITWLPAPLPAGVQPPLGIRVAAIDGAMDGKASTGWFIEFLYRDVGRGERWAPGAPDDAADFQSEADAAAVARILANGWKCPVETTIVHARDRGTSHG